MRVSVKDFECHRSGRGGGGGGMGRKGTVGGIPIHYLNGGGDSSVVRAPDS